LLLSLLDTLLLQERKTRVGDKIRSVEFWNVVYGASGEEVTWRVWCRSKYEIHIMIWGHHPVVYLSIKCLFLLLLHAVVLNIHDLYTCICVNRVIRAFDWHSFISLREFHYSMFTQLDNKSLVPAGGYVAWYLSISL
jgi:hypothetical protein